MRLIAPFGRTVWTVNGKGIQTFTSELFWKQEIEKVYRSFPDLHEIFSQLGAEKSACEQRHEKEQLESSQKISGLLQEVQDERTRRMELEQRLNDLEASHQENTRSLQKRWEDEKAVTCDDQKRMKQVTASKLTTPWSFYLSKLLDH